MPYKILIICQYGASSCLLVNRMLKAADAQRVNVSVNACSEMMLEEEVVEADIVLIAPQVRFMSKEIHSMCEDYSVPIMDIGPKDYGNMDGSKILEIAIDRVNQVNELTNSD